MPFSRDSCSLYYMIILIAASLLIAAGAQATSVESGGDIHISNLHHIEDDLYIFGSNVTVDGRIDGDLAVGAYEFYSNGEVTESENVFAYKLHHTGTVGNSLRAFANTVIIDGKVGRSVMLFAYDSHIDEGAVIERDVSIAGYSVHVDGVVKRNVEVNSDRIFISGDIGGNVNLVGKEITISPPAVIRGNLTYTCKNEVAIDTAAGVKILGQTQWKQPEQEPEEDRGGAGLRTVTLKLAKVLAAFLFGIIVVYLFRRYAEESFHQLQTRFPVSIATGFLSLFILVAAVLILVVSVVFLLVGLALISGKLALLGALVLVLSMLMVPITAFMTVSGGIILYSGKILFAFLVGYLLLRVFKADVVVMRKTQLLVGLIVLTLLFSVPYAGFLIYLLVSIAGAGGIVLGIKSCRPGLNRSISSDVSGGSSEQ